MATTDRATLYDDLLDLFADSADVNRLLAFQLPADKQRRLEALLRKSKTGSLTSEERGDLDEYERLEHLGRMLKARLRQRHSR